MTRKPRSDPEPTLHSIAECRNESGINYERLAMELYELALRTEGGLKAVLHQTVHTWHDEWYMAPREIVILAKCLFLKKESRHCAKLLAKDGCLGYTNDEVAKLCTLLSVPVVEIDYAQIIKLLDIIEATKQRIV